MPTCRQKTVGIVPYDANHLQEVLDLSVLAWTPVFPLMKQEIPEYTYDAFYPDGWKARQLADIADTCRDDDTSLWITRNDGKVSGFVAIRIHREDSMGEIYVIAVHPDY